jgi:hypothetical protein
MAQVKIYDEDSFFQRIQAAESAGLISNKSALGQLAFSHAIEHGQAATEALLRGTTPSPSPAQQQDGVLLQRLGAIDTGTRDLRRVVIETAAAIAALLVMLAAGVSASASPA